MAMSGLLCACAWVGCVTRITSLSSPYNTVHPGGVVEFDFKRNDRPVPYIAGYTPTGILTIGWDRTMQPYEQPKKIPATKVAIE